MSPPNPSGPAVPPPPAPAGGQLDPQAMLDLKLIVDLAATNQASVLERKNQCLSFHEKGARQHCRALHTALKTDVQKASIEVTNLTAQIKSTKAQLTKTGRFVAHASEDAKLPADGYVYGKFIATLALEIALIVAGAVTISLVMRGNPTFAGSAFKTLAIAASIVLLPAWILSIPAALLRKRTRALKAYLAVLMLAGLCFGGLFALTFALNYGRDSSADLLENITTLGVESESVDGADSEPWLSRNAAWLQLFSQVIADVLLAGASTTYLSYLAMTHDLFRPRARSENDDYRTLEQEIRDLEQRLTAAEGHKTQAEERLKDADRQTDDFVFAVRFVAEARFNRELDLFLVEREQAEAADRELQEKLTALDEAKRRRDAIRSRTPGVARDGGSPFS